MKAGVWRTLAGGLTCVSLTVIGQALSQDGAAGAAAAAGGLVAGPVGAAVGGLAAKALGNFLGDSGGDLIMNGGREALSSWLSRGGPKPGELPLNHDLARAIRLSQLDALDFIVTLHAQAHGAARFARRVRDWTDAGRREAAAPDFLETPDDGALLTDLAAVLEDIGARLPAPGTVPAMAEDAMLAELRAAGEVRGWPIDQPDAFERRFRGEAAHAGWLAATNAFFAARLKDEKAVALRAAFELDQFRGLNLQLAGIQRALAASDTAIHARLDAIEAALRAVGAAEADVPDPGRLAARGASASDIATELQRLLATSPRWSRTAAAVRLRQARLLARPMFGREDAFSALDAFLCDRPGGLLILTGAAGAGKSSLLARWLESAAPTNAVRHFISADLPATTSPEAIEGHIAAQLDTLLATASAIPADDQPAGERIYQRLAAFTPSAATSRLVIVLDGLDEAAARIESFIPAPLPEGVFVVIGCRAASDTDAPRVLRPWLDVLDQRPDAGVRLHLSGLDLPDVCRWLAEVAPLMPREARDRLAADLHRNLEGLPLFLSEVVSTLPPAAEGARAVAAAPDSFGAYVRARLAELEGAGDVWALSNRRLFALLGLAHAPLRQWEIEDLFAVMAGGLSIELNSLDPRIARWFVMRGEGSERTFAFHHPRLAAAFSEQLGTDADVAAETLTLWLAQAWRPRPRRPGAPYALDWGPRQLCELAVPDAAVRLLTDSAFLAARFERHETALDRARRTIEDWRRLAADGHEGAGRPHAAFWALHGERLKQAWRPVAAARTPYGRVVLNALADAGLFDGEPGRAVIAHPPARSVLARAALHPGLAEAISGHGLIMSGGRRGDVLFWDADGRARGEPDGPIRHSAEVRRLVVLNDGFASIGEDGRVLFWTDDGRPRHDTLPPPAHADTPLGARPLPDGGLVTHDVDGIVVFWGPDGRERARETFAAAVRQAVIAHDRVFLTCDNGRCALREVTGAPAEPLRPSILAQAPGAASAAALPDGFVSWSFNSPPVFWSREGRLRPAAESAGRLSGLRECLVHQNGVAGRTTDHRLAFWTPDGTALEEAVDDAAARVGPPSANGDRLLVVDAAGAAEVRDFRGRLIGRTPALGFEDSAGVWPVTGGWLIAGFWGGASAIVSLEGRVLSVPEVCPRVTTCLARPRLTLTGDLEGRIRLWSTTGDLLSHPFPPELHASASNGVRGLLEVEDRLVSYGGDGLIKFWRVSALNGAFDLVEPDPVDGATSHGAAGPDGAVSWDHYGRLLFWSADGVLLSEVILDTAVAEAVLLDEVVIVLERDNRVHVFTRTGERLAQDDALTGRDAGVYAGRLTPFPGGCAATGDQALLLIDLEGRIRTRSADVWGDASPIREVAAVEDGVVLVNPVGAPALARFDGLRTGNAPRGTEAGFPDLTVSGRDVVITLGSSLRIWAVDDIDGPPRIIRSTPGALLGAADLSPGFATFEQSGGVAFWTADGGMRARRYPFAGGSRPARWISRDGRLYVADGEGALTVWNADGTLLGEHSLPEALIGLTPLADGLAAGDLASGLHWFTDVPEGPATAARSVLAHAGDLAVKLLSDGRLLSWAPGDIIHIWSGPAALDDTLVVPDEIRHLACVADGLYVFGSRLWRFRWDGSDAPPPPSDAPGW